MRKLMLVAVLCVAGYYYYQHHRPAPPEQMADAVAEQPTAPVVAPRSQPVSAPAFRCEGKTRFAHDALTLADLQTAVRSLIRRAICGK